MMKMNLIHLRYFVELADTRHYTKAAQQLCITQPSLSHAIAQLEKELGVPLFEKNGRNTELTVFGRQFLDYAEKTLSMLDEGAEAVKKGARGEGLIRLGLIRPLGVDFIPGLIADFLKEQPGKDIRFTLGTGKTAELFEGLEDGRYDLIFSSKPEPDSGFKEIEVCHQKLVLIVPKGHPLSGRRSVSLEETLKYPYIAFAAGTGLRAITDGLFEKIGKYPRILYEIEEDEVVAGMAAHGFGIAVVPYMEMLKRLNVDLIEITYPAWERPLSMVWDDRIFMPPAVREFCRFVSRKESFRQFPQSF